MNELLDAALDYATRFGWAVFPCKPRDKCPLTAHGLCDASTDLEQIRAWWRRWPDANIGLPTGARFHVLDVDAKQLASSVVRALFREHGTTTRGPKVRTGGGGVHVYFAPPDRPVGNRARFIEACDWRGNGGYAIAPPSVHASGHRYTWARHPRRWPLPKVPAWLLDLLDPPRPPHPVRQALVRRTASSRYVESAFAGEVHRAATAVKGTRNDSLNRASFSLAQLGDAGLLRHGEIEAALLSAARVSGLVEDEGERAALATIESGMRGAKKKPRHIA